MNAQPVRPEHDVRARRRMLPGWLRSRAKPRTVRVRCVSTVCGYEASCAGRPDRYCPWCGNDVLIELTNA